MRAGLIHPDIGGTNRRDPDLAIAEAESLILALDVELLWSSVTRLSRVVSGTFFAPGKIDEVASEVSEHDLGLVVVDTQLSPVQQRNLERAWKAKVLDRTGLILEIFGARARTKEGVLQVDLAHLTYQRSRLVRSWTHLERQRGGRGFMGGPGERQIEADRRAIDDQVVRLKKRLEKVAGTRGLHRDARARVPYPVVALVGYTNAGKSTIFNVATGAKVLAKDMVFATLDPTMRAIQLPRGRDAILSDTVGFITDLPTELVAAFRATLEEVRDADLIVHVRDISHPETDLQNDMVLQILQDLGAGVEHDQTIIEVWNKVDRLDEDALSRTQMQAARRDDVVMTSALSGDGLDDLFDQILAKLRRHARSEKLSLPQDAGKARSWLYECRVVDGETLVDGRMVFEVIWDAAERGRFFATFGDELGTQDA